MKRFVSVLAFLLILTLSLTTSTQALNQPWNYDRPDNETHPWGGDEVVTDPPPLTVDSKYGSDTYATGIYVVDVIFKYLISSEYFINNMEGSRVQNALLKKYENQKIRQTSTLKKERIR